MSEVRRGKRRNSDQPMRDASVIGFGSSALLEMSVDSSVSDLWEEHYYGYSFAGGMSKVSSTAEYQEQSDCASIPK